MLAAPPAPSGAFLLAVVPHSGSIVDGSGGCVDNVSNRTVEGNFIKVWPCNDSGAQVWDHGSDQTLRTRGKCMRPASMASGASIALYTCTGASSEAWRFRSDGVLVNIASGLCLQNPGPSAAAGRHLVLRACSPGSGQLWSMP